MHVSVGFVVLCRRGEFLAWAASLEVACLRLREKPEASTIERCSDNRLMAFKRSKKRRPGERFAPMEAA